jgi:hypothetical protein
MLYLPPTVASTDHWPIHHNTQDDVITTTLRHRKHEVSRAGIRRCGSYDERM